MRRLIPLAAVALVGAAAAWWAASGSPGAGSLSIPGENERVTVEVLNATGVDGLARDVTGRLRRAGLDVVYFGTAAMDTLSVTRVVVRRGDESGARRVRDVLQAGQIAMDPDPHRLLDVSVLLGRDLVPASRDR